MKNLLTNMLFVGCVAVALCGCSRQEETYSYNVPKQPQVKPSSAARPMAGSPAPGETDGSPQRMLAAMVLKDNQAWFFKVTGSAKLVSPEADRFREFVGSVRFAEADPSNPTWTLPEGWKAEAGSGMRFATVKLQSQEGQTETPPELTVIPLRVTMPDTDQYVLENVNRWRGQIGLGRISAVELPTHSERVDLGGLTATLVDFSSASSGDSKSSLPADHPPVGTSKAGPSGAAAGTAQPTNVITYEAPAEWEAGQPSGMRKAEFAVRDGDRELEITVIDLSATAADLTSSVNLWRQQVGLPTLDEEQLQQQFGEIEMDGVPGKYVELVGPEDVPPQVAIFGAIAVRDGKSWFVKLIGDAALAEREKEPFSTFVKSIRFGQNKEQ